MSSESEPTDDGLYPLVDGSSDPMEVSLNISVASHARRGGRIGIPPPDHGERSNNCPSNEFGLNDPGKTLPVF